jgi:hypothetical protein
LHSILPANKIDVTSIVLMRFHRYLSRFFGVAISLATACTALATSTYEYKPGEYVVIKDGKSPNGEYSIAAHGEGEYGDERTKYEIPKFDRYPENSGTFRRISITHADSTRALTHSVSSFGETPDVIHHA